MPNYLPFTYPLDVSAYLEQMYAKQLILVNKTTEPLTEKDKPDDLVKLSDMDGCAVANDGTAYYLRSDAAYALAAMMQAMVLQEPDAQGTVVTSAYRGYAYQESLFERYIANEAKKYPNATREELEAIVAEYSAPPGTSEHQTGLCFDFTCPEVGGDVVEEFEDTAAFAWLAANAYKYGFILRYPKDKVDITGYQYEPWHYRFVGVEAATEMHRTGLSLEEYLATPEA